MRKREPAGTKYMPELDAALDANQEDIVDTLIHPHSTRLNEMLGPQHRITSVVPAYEPEAQPVQARGHIVWNKAYAFQSHGPTYLDPVSDDEAVPYAR